MQTELLTTGQVASLLGSSRQHVVDLCERGDLPCVTIGTHRRIKRDAVDAFLRRPQEQENLRREQLTSLWLHRAVAGQLVQQPDAVLTRARANLERLARQHASARPWLDAWRSIMDAGPEQTLRVLTAPDDDAAELRQNSPFAGALSERERARVLAAVRAYRRRRGR